MKLVELVFREVNVVLVHAGVVVPSISLDRVRSARPASNMSVSTVPNQLTVQYLDERAVVQFDPQRITATDTSTRGPETTSVVEIALAQHEAIGLVPAVAFGFNIRMDFEVEGLPAPAGRLASRLLRDPPRVIEAIRADSFDLGVNLVYRRGVKLWSLRLDPLPGARRLAVHANIHEDLVARPTEDSEAAGPAWLEPRAELPGADGMNADLRLQARTTLESVVNLLAL